MNCNLVSKGLDQEMKEANVVIGLWWRRSASHAEGGLGQRDIESLPQALLYDLSGVTGRQYHKLTSRATPIGRVAPEQGCN
jgi:hypothetical protein